MTTYNRKMELRKFLMNARVKKDEELSTMTEEIMGTIKNHLGQILSLPEGNPERIKYESRVIQIEAALINRNYGSFRSSAYFVMDLLML